MVVRQEKGYKRICNITLWNEFSNRPKTKCKYESLGDIACYKLSGVATGMDVQDLRHKNKNKCAEAIFF